MNLVIVVPALNESAVIYNVLKSLPRKIEGISSIKVLVVDDGSSDATTKEASRQGAYVVRHVLNRGLGAAIKTGFYWARKRDFDILVTFDADGQHNPSDIEKLIKPIIKKRTDIVIGSRFKSQVNLPKDRIVINWLANIATFVLYGVFSSDSQSGLRAFSKKAFSSIEFKGDRMEFSSEIFLEAKRLGLKFTEVPITAKYTIYSRKKGQKNINAIPVFFKTLMRLAR